MNDSDTYGEAIAVDLGMISVPEAEDLMGVLRGVRAEGSTPDLLLFMAHPKTVAVGLRDKNPLLSKDLLVSPDRLEAEGIALTRSIRGGGITYHWPGQVVCYPVLALRARERNISGYMTNLEEVGIRTLGRFGLRAVRRRDSHAHIGLWVNGCKVVSMGVRVSDWITSFGFAINLEGDTEPSRYIRPCGIEGIRLTTVEESLAEAASRSRTLEVVKEEFAAVFGRKVRDISDDPSDDIVSLVSQARYNGRHSRWLRQ